MARDDLGYGDGRRGDGAGAPFIPEEAYRLHPEYDQPPRNEWQAGGGDEELGDEGIRDGVLRHMRNDAWLDSQKITVEVEDGVVTLTGEVGDFLEARYAGDDAWESPGVRGVMNPLTVRTDLPGAPHGDVLPQTSGARPELAAEAELPQR